MLVEVKSGETFNGTLESCDRFMNLKLTDVIRTSKEGNRFEKMASVFLRGNSVKYIRMVDQVLQKAQEEKPRKEVKEATVQKPKRGRDKGDGPGRGKSAPSRGGRRGARGH
eukprot:TRINITY_DN1975_c0_g1_i1.p1 TRINITY_DN1975_c0_g1~~TRINITY_DN1975_c0_g1_i1.p1  ORF type:complete len:111 (+),score=26.24 TRINITY_DN1975_c0_g1_i1:88-420(+)